MDITEVEPAAIMGHTVDYATYAGMYDAQNSEKPLYLNRAKIVKLDQKHDLALLETPLSTAASVELGGSVAIGQSVFSIGHPSGLSFTFARGYISTPCRILEEGMIPAGFSSKACWDQIDMTIHGGSSGGGLFDESGRLIGVCSMGGDEGQAFYVPPEYVEKFVTSP
jgi:S1-C subfamily serine protease